VDVVLTRGDVDVATWTVANGTRPTLDVVERLARLQLAAGRLGCAIRLTDANRELWDLLELCGLADRFGA
jgi:hypothetical protein